MFERSESSARWRNSVVPDFASVPYTVIISHFDFPFAIIPKLTKLAPSSSAVMPIPVSLNGMSTNLISQVCRAYP